MRAQGGRTPGLAGAHPVEYSVAVERYLAAADLRPASRRIYRISLTSWAWPLVGKPPPHGTSRRGARPPVVPLAMLDDDAAAGKLAAAVADRARQAGARTVNRELSALRGAIWWWQDQRWIQRDPAAGLRHLAALPVAGPPLTGPQLAALWRCPAGLREQALWHLLHDCAAPMAAVLGLDAGQVDLSRRSARVPAGPADHIDVGWSESTGTLLGWLLAGRRHGPVFLTGRRAPGQAAAGVICPLTGRARMSYRRAAEIFTSCTRPLDPAGRGWTLHQLRPATGRAGVSR
jgi:hypothetical protein